MELEASLKKTQDKADFGLFQTHIEAMVNTLVAAGIQVFIPQFLVIHFRMLTIRFIKTC